MPLTWNSIAIVIQFSFEVWEIMEMHCGWHQLCLGFCPHVLSPACHQWRRGGEGQWSNCHPPQILANEKLTFCREIFFLKVQNLRLKIPNFKENFRAEWKFRLFWYTFSVNNLQVFFVKLQLVAPPTILTHDVAACEWGGLWGHSK